MSTIVLILKGSSSKKIKEWMKDLDYYGPMKCLTVKDINSFLHKVIEMGYIEDYDIGNCVRVIRCTDQGNTFDSEYKSKLQKMVENQDNNVEGLLQY